uniref:Transmembrane protein n=1 Tax=Panagrellus redivivus TaxID=6233 RepID=A0A7E4USD0_PANRE
MHQYGYQLIALILLNVLIPQLRWLRWLKAKKIPSKRNTFQTSLSAPPLEVPLAEDVLQEADHWHCASRDPRHSAPTLPQGYPSQFVLSNGQPRAATDTRISSIDCDEAGRLEVQQGGRLAVAEPQAMFFVNPTVHPTLDSRDAVPTVVAPASPPWAAPPPHRAWQGANLQPPTVVAKRMNQNSASLN